MFHSIDKAVIVKRIDTISRSVTIVEELQKKHISVSIAVNIVEYAKGALRELKGEKK